MYVISRAIPEIEATLAGHLEAAGFARGLRKYVDFMHMDMNIGMSYDHSLYDVAAGFTTILDSQTTSRLTSKHRLGENFTQWIAETWPIEQFQWAEGVYILRPSGVGMCGGKDIKIVSSRQEFAAAAEFYAALAQNFAKRRKEFRVIVSRYLTDPLLFNGRKMHLRMYLLTVFDGVAARTVLAPFGKILTAALPFTLGDYQNPAIHDTHMGSTDRDYYYPENYVGPDISEQLASLAADLAPIANEARPYKTSYAGCQYYGLDIMVNAGKIVLIEVNDKVGLETKGDKGFYSRFANWLWQEISPNVTQRKYATWLDPPPHDPILPIAPAFAGIAGGQCVSTADLREYPIYIVYNPRGRPAPKTSGWIGYLAVKKIKRKPVGKVRGEYVFVRRDGEVSPKEFAEFIPNGPRGFDGFYVERDDVGICKITREGGKWMEEYLRKL